MLRSARQQLAEFERFCNTLILDTGRRMRLEPFQRVMLLAYFAGVTETLILLPKKNGKTTLLAALALHHLLTTPDAACYIGAASRDQATILYNQARGLVNRSGWLKKHIKVQGGYRRLLSRHDDGALYVVAADADTVDGVIPTLALVDELHRHRSGDLLGVFRDGLGPRNGLLLIISTAGDDEESALGQLRRNAHALPGQVIEGAHRHVLTQNFAMHEWALEPGQDRTDMKVVKLANPASWQTPEALAKRFHSPSMTAWQWARFACGVWMAGEDALVEEADWIACEDREAAIPPAVSGVAIGIDFGWKWDTTSLTPAWRDPGSGLVIAHEPTILVPPRDGTLLDADLVWRSILRYHLLWPDAMWVLDPNAGGEQMAQRMETELGALVVIHSQMPSPMGLATQRLLTVIGDRTLRHPGHRVLTRHVLAAAGKPVGEGVRFFKGKKKLPIDAAVSLAMAVSQLMAPVEQGPSIYEEREAIVI